MTTASTELLARPVARPDEEPSWWLERLALVVGVLALLAGFSLLLFTVPQLGAANSLAHNLPSQPAAVLMADADTAPAVYSSVHSRTAVLLAHDDSLPAGY